MKPLPNERAPILPLCYRCGQSLPDGEGGSDDEHNRPGRMPLCRQCADGDPGEVFDIGTLKPLEQ